MAVDHEPLRTGDQKQSKKRVGGEEGQVGLGYVIGKSFVLLVDRQKNRDRKGGNGLEIRPLTTGPPTCRLE
jgi:hypothetical protein